MTVCFTPYLRDPITGGWALPHSGRADQDEFEVDLCNASAVDLLFALGLNPLPTGEPIPLDVFANLVTAALRRHLGQRSPEVAALEDAQPGRMTIIHLGRGEGYIERRLRDLARAIQRSRAIGVIHFGWG